MSGVSPPAGGAPFIPVAKPGAFWCGKGTSAFVATGLMNEKEQGCHANESQ